MRAATSVRVTPVYQGSSTPISTPAVSRWHPLRRVALAAGAATALCAVVLLAAAAGARSAAAGPYVNPWPAEIRAKLKSAAVARSIPPRILYAIAWQESAWRQFDVDGDPLIGFDGKGIGIMQVTTIPAGADVERLKADVEYNIATGADILLTKWGMPRGSSR